MNIPTEYEIRLRAEVHLRRLTLGRLFTSYQARWSGREAYDLLSLIEELCSILDHVGPALLDDICAKRREEVGLPSGRGDIVQASKERQTLSGGYADLMNGSCNILRQAINENAICCWNDVGCAAMQSVLEELIRKATCVLPAILKRAQELPPDKLSEMYSVM